MELKKLKESLEQLGIETVKEVLEQLLAADKKATGSLINSIRYEILETSDALLLNILSNEYFKYIDEGRTPGKKQPPTKSIIPWVQSRGIKFKNNKGKFLSTESTAFLISRSIGKKGFKPLNIKQKVVNNILDKKKDFLAMGLKIDIEEYIRKEIFN